MTQSQEPYDIPMIFSAPLVKANLDGRKCQTRRMPTAILNKAYEAQQAGRPLRLWQRETFSINFYNEGSILPIQSYWATPKEQRTQKNARGIYYQQKEKMVFPRRWAPEDKWTPSIFMPRFASRFTGINLVISKECVQDITENDAIAEGVEQLNCTSHTQSFMCVWNTLHGKKPGEDWTSNPEVYVLSYTGINKNIDKVGAS